MNNIDYNKDYYSILGVNKGASQDEIKKAFHKASMKYHPDRQQGKDQKEVDEAKSKFQEINDAYEVLGNKDNRENYDQVREMGGRRMHMGGFGFGGMGGADSMMRDFMRRHGFGDMDGMDDDFDGFSSRSNFRQHHRPRNPVNGQNIHIDVKLPFESFFFGCTKTLDIKVNSRCPHCKNGLEGDSPEYSTCPTCHGRGMTTTQHGNMIMSETCHNCMGTGEVLRNKCKHCNGTTVIGTRTQSCTFEIPKFSYSGFTKTYDGVGHCGIFGGNAGNISITAYMNEEGRFALNNPQYDNETLKTIHFVPILKAIIGGTEKILTPYGYTDVEIPCCMENPTEIRIPNKGMKRKNSNENADLVVYIQWDIPAKVNEKEREAIQKALKLMGSRKGAFVAVEKLKEYDNEYIKQIKDVFPSSEK